MKILITGTAGFIGYHLATSLLARGDSIVGLDVINDYYDVQLKYDRLKQHGIEKDEIDYNKLVNSKVYANYRFIKLDLTDKKNLDPLFEKEDFDVVCNLAAQAGVRYSITNPEAYTNSNIIGFLNILEACRYNPVKHLVYASSSSVYGLNEKMPFSTSDNVDHPVSLYAASKKSNELMAHCYSQLYKIPTTGLRFFTVYGPWGRPDMALFLFTKAIMEGKPIDVFNHGEMERDFTYIDDIVDGIKRVINIYPKGDPEWSGMQPDPAGSVAPYRLFNIGNCAPVKLLDFIDALEKEIGKKAERNLLPIQPGDVEKTWADVSHLEEIIQYKPSTSVQKGIHKFVKWYKKYYKL